MKKACLWWFVLLVNMYSLQAQTAPPCPTPDTPAADSCANICIYCNFNGYNGTTTGYTGQTPPGFCGTIENEQWIGFVAGAAAATFSATPSNCTTGNGLQIALYPSCDNTPLQCNGGVAGGGGTPVSVTASLTPGVSYYLLIDGYAGDQCDFQLTVVPPSAMQAPGVGQTGILSGPTGVCPGAEFNYSVPPVSGAGAYHWSAPPGWLINGQPAPVTLLGAGGNIATVTPGFGSGQICVEPLNACNTGAMVCKNVTAVPIPVTVLPKETVCAEDVPYILPWGDEVFNSGTFEYTYSSTQGCDSVVRQTVTVKAPILKFLAPQTICNGDSILVCGEAFKQAGSFSNTCTSYQGCDSIINFSILLLEPIANITPGAVNCATPPVTLNSASTPGIKLWKDANGQVVGNGNTLTVSDPGTYILEVNTPAGGNICTASDTVVVLFGATVPTAAAASTDTLTCIQNSVPLDGNTDTPGAHFFWSGPGGFASTQEDPLANAPGQYTLTVTHPESGCSSQATVEVLADVQAPDVLLSSDTVSCTTPAVQIQCSTSVAEPLFSWAGPAGFIAEEQNPITGTPGLYTVTVTATANGCASTAEITVPGGILPPSAITTGGTLTCAVSAIQLTCTTNADMPSFSWQGPAGFSSVEQNPETSIQGTYEVTVTGADGCTATSVALVLENKQAPAIEVAGNTLSCTQPYDTLECTTQAALPYFDWSGPGFSSILQNPIVTAAGTYTVTVTDTNNGCTNTASIEIALTGQLPEVNIAPPAVLTCIQTSVLLEGNSPTANPVFSWIGPNGFSAGSPATTAEIPGVYVLVVSDTAIGCAGADQVTIVEDVDAPGAEVSGAGTITCATPVLSLNGSSSLPDASYQWLAPGLPPIAGQALSVNAPGLYILVVTDPGNGCVSTASALVLQDTVHPAFALQADTITCRTDSLFIGAPDPQGYQFEWTGPNGFSTQQSGFWIQLSELGAYQATVTNPGNGCTQVLTVDEFVQNLVPPVIDLVAITDDQLSQQIGAIDIGINYPGAVMVAWYRDGVLLSNQEDIANLPAGKYTVVVTANDNGCTASLVLVISNLLVSTDAVSKEAYWDIFPNPASARLQLRYHGPGRPETTLLVTDVAGRVVINPIALTVPYITLPVEHLPPGMYRLLIQTPNGALWKPVVIQR